MAQGDLGIVLGIVGIVITVVLGLAALPRRRRSAPHWTRPDWKTAPMKVGGQRLPVLTIRWNLRGSSSIQGVSCAVRLPSGAWRECKSPRGSLDPPKDGLFTHVNLVDGETFNATIASPADIGKPVTDLTGRAVKGKYALRIQWVEPEIPSRVRRKEFLHVVR